MTQKTLEKHIENQIKKYLDSIGCWQMKVHGSMYQKAGVPDILACVNGRFIGIEVKRPGGVVAALQIYNINQILKSGGIAFVAYSVEDVKTYLKQFNLI